MLNMFRRCDISGKLTDDYIVVGRINIPFSGFGLSREIVVSMKEVPSLLSRVLNKNEDEITLKDLMNLKQTLLMESGYTSFYRLFPKKDPEKDFWNCLYEGITIQNGSGGGSSLFLNKSVILNMLRKGELIHNSFILHESEIPSTLLIEEADIILDEEIRRERLHSTFLTKGLLI